MRHIPGVLSARSLGPGWPPVAGFSGPGPAADGVPSGFTSVSHNAERRVANMGVRGGPTRGVTYGDLWVFSPAKKDAISGPA